MKILHSSTKALKIIPVLSILWAPWSRAEDLVNNASYEAHAVHAFLLYCVPALSVRDSVARVAQMQKLPELPAAAEAAFLQGKPGKVFGLPEVGAGAVLTAPDTPLCSVIIQKLDPQEFIKQVDYWFAQGKSPFKMEQNNILPSGEINRQYTTSIGGTNIILLLVKVRPRPVDGGVQALLTAGRTSAQ
jgi:hypothetical protein